MFIKIFCNFYSGRWRFEKEKLFFSSVCEITVHYNVIKRISVLKKIINSYEAFSIRLKCKNVSCQKKHLLFKRLFASTTSLYMIELPAPLYVLFIVYFRRDLCFYEPGTICCGIPSVKSDILVTTVYDV